MLKYYRIFAICTVIIGFYCLSHIALIRHYERNTALQNSQISVFASLPPLFLKALALEFKGVTADILLLEAGSQVGTKVVKTTDNNFKALEENINWDNVYRYFVSSQSLDPYFQQTYMLAQGLLPWGPGMIDETQNLLRNAASMITWDWNPLHFMGFNAYFFRNDFGTAGKLYLEASKIKDAPVFLSILGAKLALKGSETESAVLMLKNVLQDFDQSDPGYSAIKKRLIALEGCLKIEKAAKVFEEEYGYRPVKIEDITQAGFLNDVPFNPYNKKYCFDQDGRINFECQ